MRYLLSICLLSICLLSVCSFTYGAMPQCVLDGCKDGKCEKGCACGKDGKDCKCKPGKRFPDCKCGKDCPCSKVKSLAEGRVESAKSGKIIILWVGCSH